MVYVDENLCTACGLCLDACEQGALAMQGPTAVIDDTLCTSCERCVEVCPTGAIILAEVVSERPPSPALAQNQGVQPVWAGASSPSPAGIGAGLPSKAPSAAKPVATSKLEIAEKLLSGLFSVVALALERKQSGSVRSNVSATRGAEGGTANTGRGGRGTGLRLSRGGGRRLRIGQGRGVGKGLGTGQGRRNGQGRNNGCRGEGRNRVT
jgi:NAD-dependent dihydropyrimidine dehydrogenase PreA subunit